jgi:hypothetical protein
VTFIDDFSRYTYVYLISHKSWELTHFKKCKLEVERQHGRNIKVLRSNRGGEYNSKEFNIIFEMHEIKKHSTIPYMP